MSARRFRCNSCGYVYVEATPGHSHRLHRCVPAVNPGYDPDPGSPTYDPRDYLPIDNPRDENPEYDLDFDPDHPRPRRPTRQRAEGKGRTLVSEEE